MNKETTDALGGVGAKMRALREAKKISLRALARRVDVTPSLISQIETGKINPSVSSLYAIANALDAPMDAFFGRTVTPEPESTENGCAADVGDVEAGGMHTSRIADRGRNAPGMVDSASESATAPGDHTHHAAYVRRADREKIVIDGFGGLLVWERLTPEHESFVDFLEIQYECGASSAQNLMRHSGREYGLVLEGELTVNLGFEEFTLGVGDSIAYDSTQPHRLTNRGDTLARAVWAVVKREAERGSRD
ncbi:MAG: helix-turn-helix domain-containing protein [Thermoleophilia bacterium]